MDSVSSNNNKDTTEKIHVHTDYNFFQKLSSESLSVLVYQILMISDLKIAYSIELET